MPGGGGGARGAMDNASDYGSEDSRFESWRARTRNFFYDHLYGKSDNKFDTKHIHFRREQMAKWYNVVVPLCRTIIKPAHTVTLALAPAPAPTLTLTLTLTHVLIRTYHILIIIITNILF